MPAYASDSSGDDPAETAALAPQRTKELDLFEIEEEAKQRSQAVLEQSQAYLKKIRDLRRRLSVLSEAAATEEDWQKYYVEYTKFLVSLDYPHRDKETENLAARFQSLLSQWRVSEDASDDLFRGWQVEDQLSNARLNREWHETVGWMEYVLEHDRLYRQMHLKAIGVGTAAVVGFVTFMATVTTGGIAGAVLAASGATSVGGGFWWLKRAERIQFSTISAIKDGVLAKFFEVFNGNEKLILGEADHVGLKLPPLFRKRLEKSAKKFGKQLSRANCKGLLGS